MRYLPTTLNQVLPGLWARRLSGVHRGHLDHPLHPDGDPHHHPYCGRQPEVGEAEGDLIGDVGHPCADPDGHHPGHHVRGAHLAPDRASRRSPHDVEEVGDHRVATHLPHEWSEAHRGEIPLIVVVISRVIAAMAAQGTGGIPWWGRRSSGTARLRESRPRPSTPLLAGTGDGRAGWAMLLELGCPLGGT